MWREAGSLWAGSWGSRAPAQKGALRWRSFSGVDGCGAMVRKRRPKGAPEERLSPSPKTEEIVPVISHSILPSSCLSLYFLKTVLPVLPIPILEYMGFLDASETYLPRYLAEGTFPRRFLPEGIRLSS